MGAIEGETYMKKHNFDPIKILGAIFAVIGLIFVTIALCFLITEAVSKDRYEEITAVITSIERYPRSDENTDHDVRVEYEYGGNIYSGISLNYYSSSMYEGETIRVMVDADEPEKVHSPASSLLLTAIFGGLGLVFAVIGLSLLISIRRKGLLKKRLIKDGCHVMAHIDGVVTTNVRINNRPTYAIRCSYNNPEDGRIYSFTSEALMFDPSWYINTDTLRVYVDRNDYTKNYVDVSELKDKYIEC